MIENETLFENIRRQFPALTQKVHGREFVYLDSAATTLKPESVAQRVYKFNQYEISNVHRGAHYFADQATQKFEEARKTTAVFLNTKTSEEIVFVRGTTEAMGEIRAAWVFNIGLITIPKDK